MRLCNIKLSGFKSFVDPTNLALPNNLIGIVGPNGCGKSNIIDAVTWVMGESSAKHLRGESLTDVIFNGSNTRKPVGLAAVELVFDNSERRLAGQYASYNTISVKREITHDAVSTYYLNGSRCRRKDITALFLGTGLGPRSYAIIEQGMISQLIEAKPEDLRLFIEEAADISKYRERRRETENRIKHTKENLARLDDIREELAKQLRRLHQQTKAAERYQQLKQQERQLAAELLALNWRDLNNDLTQFKETMGQAENAVAKQTAAGRKIETAIEKLRLQQTTANEHFNERQSEYYKIGSDISKQQQELQHTEARIKDFSAEIETVNQRYTETTSQQTTAQAEYKKIQQALTQLTPKLKDTQHQRDQTHALLDQAQSAMDSWQSEWDQVNESLAELKQQEQVNKTRLEHFEQGLDGLTARHGQLKQLLLSFEETDFDSKTETLAEAVATELAQQTTLDDAYAAQQKRVDNYREQRTTLAAKLDIARQESQRLTGSLSSLQTLQQQVLEDNPQLNHWLAANELKDQKRLAQLITINPRWSQATETVISRHLDAICVDDIEHYLAKLDSKHGKFSLISTKKRAPATAKKYPRLIDEITTTTELSALLANIYLATSLKAAIKMLPELSAEESVVTESGIWLSHDWVIVNPSDDDNDNVLNREAEITQLSAQLKQQTTTTEGLAATLAKTETDLKQAETQLNEQQSVLAKQQQSVADLKAQLAAAESEAKQQTQRRQQSLAELDATKAKTTADKLEIDQLKQHLQQIATKQQQLNQERSELANKKATLQQAVVQAQQTWQHSYDENHQLALQLQEYRSQLALCEQTITTNTSQIEQLTSRKDDLAQQLSAAAAPVTALKNNIELGLKNKLAAEQNLTTARTKVSDIDTQIRNAEQDRHQVEEQQEALRAELATARDEVSRCQVKIESVAEQLNNQGQGPKTLLANLEASANQEEWTAKKATVTNKIDRLGAINLAAISEYKQESERKTYLDSQHDDLTEGLKTLERAIKKIDKETKTRFKETFDKLNQNIQELFPVLFGGGHAYLEMMSEDLLQTGIALMARPPGKKNSSIHLLSGGEKALTAVALVFSIFKLNPAPFCILDEVDAPLDDANAMRFRQLVQSMSNDVQFIFITHNKITMEIADRLIGVTMHEAGVSRFVSVDINEAVHLAQKEG